MERSLGQSSDRDLKHLFLSYLEGEYICEHRENLEAKEEEARWVIHE